MDTHLTPALVSAPSFDRTGRPAITKARAAARLQASAATGAKDGSVSELARGEVIALHGRRGQTLEVLSGRVWLTQTGGSGDHFIAAGERFTLRCTGRVVIEGDSDASACLKWSR